MSWWEALILGIVQGLTEFLPVSSSGHIEIGQYLLGTSSEENLTFTVLVHTATVLSTLVILWSEIAWLLRGCFTSLNWNKEKDYAAKLIVSMIPIFIVGMFFKSTVESFFGTGLQIVGICLIITAFLLALSDYITIYRQKRQQDSNVEVGHSVSYLDAFVIGLAQACAVLPGLSRSGSTIATGLLCGVKKSEIAQFSFLMVIVPILGDAFLELIDIIKEGSFGAGLPTGSAIVGFIAAFITGCLACRFMINIVRRGRLIWFALYCLAVGILALCLM